MKVEHLAQCQALAATPYVAVHAAQAGGTASPTRSNWLRLSPGAPLQKPTNRGASPCRLEELNEARQEQLARVKLVEREREGLEGDKQQAEAYLQKEQECLRAQSTIFLKFIWTAQVGD